LIESSDYHDVPKCSGTAPHPQAMSESLVAST
jgi:hypothetical protein